MGKSFVVSLFLLTGGSLCACSEWVMHNPATPEEHVTIGLAYEVEGHPELAAREYTGALLQQQAYIPALIGLGNLALDRKEWEEAEGYYRRALIVAPEDPGINHNLALVYLTQQEKLDEAERLADVALIQSGPLRPYVLDTIAQIYIRQGRYREAQTALNNAEVLAPKYDLGLRHRLARLQRELAAIYPLTEEELEMEI